MNAKRFVKAGFEEELKMLEAELVDDITVGECEPELLVFFQKYFDRASDMQLIILFWRTCLASVPISSPILKDLYGKLRKNTPLNQNNVLFFFELAALLDEQYEELSGLLTTVDEQVVSSELLRTIYRLSINRSLALNTESFIKAASSVEGICYVLHLSTSLAMLQTGRFRLLEASLFGPDYNFAEIFELSIKELATDIALASNLRLEDLRILGVCLKRDFRFILEAEVGDQTTGLNILRFYNCMSLMLEDYISLVTTEERAVKRGAAIEELTDHIANMYGKLVLLMQLLESDEATICTTLTSLPTEFVYFISDNLVISLLNSLYYMCGNARDFEEISKIVIESLGYKAHFESTRNTLAGIICQYIMLAFEFKNEQFNKDNIEASYQLLKIFDSFIEEVMESNRFEHLAYALLIFANQFGYYRADQEIDALLADLHGKGTYTGTLKRRLCVDQTIFEQIYLGYGVPGISIFKVELEKLYQTQYTNIEEYSHKYLDEDQYGIQVRCVFILQMVDYFVLSGNPITEFAAQMFIGLLSSVYRMISDVDERSVHVLVEYAEKLYYLVPTTVKEYFVLLIARFLRLGADNPSNEFCAEYLQSQCEVQVKPTDVEELLAVFLTHDVVRDKPAHLIFFLKRSSSFNNQELSYYQLVFQSILLAVSEDCDAAYAFFTCERRSHIPELLQNLSHFEEIFGYFLSFEHMKSSVLAYIKTYLDIALIYVQLEKCGQNFVPLLYTISSLIERHRDQFELTNADLEQFFEIYRREDIPGLDYKQNRYLQNISQSNQQFVHAVVSLGASVDNDDLWDIMGNRIDRRFKYLKQPGILELLRSEKLPSFLPELEFADAICAYNDSTLLVLRGSVIYHIGYCEQCAFELEAQELPAEQLFAGFAAKIASENQESSPIGFQNINVYVLSFINQIIDCSDVLMRSQMIEQCIYCYRE